MILADTSVWIDHIRGLKDSAALAELLEQRQIVCHAWIIGELMVGNLGPRRNKILNDLCYLPCLREYPINELRDFVDQKSLHAKGLSLIDTHLLYSCLMDNCRLWTFDKKLEKAATHFALGLH